MVDEDDLVLERVPGERNRLYEMSLTFVRLNMDRKCRMAAPYHIGKPMCAFLTPRVQDQLGRSFGNKYLKINEELGGVGGGVGESETVFYCVGFLFHAQK